MFVEFKDTSGNTHLLQKSMVQWVTDNTESFPNDKKAKTVVTIVINKTKVELPSPETIKAMSAKLVKKEDT